MTTIALLSSACAHLHEQDTPLFMGCRLMCEREGDEVDAVLETKDAIDCSCKKPEPFVT